MDEGKSALVRLLEIPMIVVSSSNAIDLRTKIRVDPRCAIVSPRPSPVFRLVGTDGLIETSVPCDAQATLRTSWSSAIL